MTRPVLDLQQVAEDAVAGAALDEVALRLEKLLCGRGAKLLDEVAEQRQLALLLDLVERDGVDDWFNDAAVVRCHDDAVWLDPQRQTLLLPDPLQHFMHRCKKNVDLKNKKR